MDDNDTSETHIGGENVNQAPIPEEDWKTVQKEMDECPGECIHWRK
ncbi:4Fe-4S single cluster domain protein [Leptospira sp. B5-022]|nr:4Fe-4S single cluster domain protein [Leptospira sp. B5-022]